LALSAVRVTCEKVIVKRFDAIQNLGAVSILCSDTTGTLTTDCVRVSSSTAYSGAPSDLAVKLAYVNSSLQTGTRSPIDMAVVDHMKEKLRDGLLADMSLYGWIKLGEIPFDSARQLHARR
jgi:Mg2+-importing ATPase